MAAVPEPVTPPKRFPFKDLGIGIGLRTVHFGHILEHWPKVDWFEVLSENFLDTRGRPAWVLDQVAERYPVVLHGVSLSIGSTDPLDRHYLKKLKALADRTRAHWVSDHLCWTGVMGRNTHDLLPMPYTEEALAPHRRAREAGERGPRTAPGAGEPVLLRGVRRLDLHRVGVPHRARGGSRLRPAARREQRLRVVRQPLLRPRRLRRRHPRATASCSTTWPATRTRAPTSSTPTPTTRCPRSGSSTGEPGHAPGPPRPSTNGTKTCPAFDVVHAEARKALAARWQRLPRRPCSFRWTGSSAGCRRSSSIPGRRKRRVRSDGGARPGARRTVGRRDPAFEDASPRGAAGHLPRHVSTPDARRPGRRLSRPRALPGGGRLRALRPGLRAGASLARLHLEPPGRSRTGVHRPAARPEASGVPARTSPGSSARSARPSTPRRPRGSRTPRSRRSRRTPGARRASFPWPP